MKRFQSRRANGRYQRNTLENCFGLTAHVCPHCGGINPQPVREPAPRQCGQCGQPLTPVPDAGGGGTNRGTDDA